MDDGRLDALGQTIVGALPGAAIGHSVAFNQLTVTVEALKIVEVVKYLRDDPACRFVNFTDVTAVDYPGREKRFDVVYHFMSPTLNARIRLRAEADETTQVPSIIDVFPGADWFEREAYDLYGVIFTGHPDMRRLLTDYGFEGHPLRKDFPADRIQPLVPYREITGIDKLAPFDVHEGMSFGRQTHDRSREAAEGDE